MAITRLKTSGVYGSKYIDALAGLPAVMAAPTATDGGTGTTVSVAFTAQSGATSYTAISSPGSFTGTGASSPITVSGLTAGTAYTFQIAATNAQGQGGYSAASNSVTPAVPPAFYNIATSLPSGSSIADFTSIPSGYASLQIRIRGFAGGGDLRMRFNGDTGSNYAWQTISGYNGTVYGQSVSGVDHLRLASNADTRAAMSSTYPTVVVIDIPTYTSTSQLKVFKAQGGVNQNSLAGSDINGNSGVWNNTAAITSIRIFNGATSFTSGTSIALYGIGGA
jgi:hypothetical protein